MHKSARGFMPRTIRANQNEVFWHIVRLSAGEYLVLIDPLVEIYNACIQSTIANFQKQSTRKKLNESACMESHVVSTLILLQAHEILLFGIT